MTKILTIANHKGGVGKTTTASSLGVALSRRAQKVLLIDLDSQCNLTSIILPKGQTPERTAWEALLEGKDLPVIKVGDYLSIVPASINLSQLDRALDRLLDDTRLAVFRLNKLLAPIAGDYDYILIDCPPSLGTATLNAFVASNGVILVMTAESLPSMGLRIITEVITKVGKNYNKKLKLEGILLTRFQRRRINKLIEETLRENFGSIVYDTKIREDVKLVESPMYQVNIYDYDPDSNGAKDYESLAEEIMNRNQNNTIQ